MPMRKELTLYSPTLRLKTGELNGIKNLREVIKDAIRPQFIIPPSAERDLSHPELFDGLSCQQNLGSALAPFWRGRCALLNPKYIYKEYGEERVAEWLPKLFEGAREANVDAVPVASLPDLEGTRFNGLVRAMDSSKKLQLAIALKADDLLDSQLATRMAAVLAKLGIASDNCSIQIDFQGSYFDEPDGVAEIIEGAYEDIQAMGTWETIVFQGTSFPDVNPATHGTTVQVPRNEWIAWKKGMSLSPSTPESFVFGDYAADSSKMHFGKGGVAAIRHYRYTTPDCWIVARAAESGNDKSRMQWVANQIIESGLFAGRTFSQADQYIFDTAKGDVGPGNSTTWRQVNTTHHLTRVVHDIALARGIVIDIPAEVEESRQLDLLDA